MVIRWVVALLGVVVAAVLGTITFVIASARIPESFIPLSAAVSNYGLYLLPVGLLGLGIALILVQRRINVVLRRIGLLVGFVCAIAMVAACVPLVASWRTAGEHDARLSVFDYVIGGSNTGKPVTATSIKYATVDGTDLLLDAKLPAHPSDTKRPAVVWVHGGGWSEGDRGEGPKWHRWLNDKGYAVFSIEYRLAPPARWNQAPADIKCAIGWVKQQAGQFGVDPERVMVAGGSAGGNLALMGAYADDRVPPSCAVGDTSVRAVAAFYPPTELVSAWRDTGAPEYGRKAMRDYLGGSPDEVPDRYAAASPTTYVRQGLPPTLLLHGARDHVVPIGQSTELAARLQAVRVEHQLLSIPFGEHAYDFTWGDWGTQMSRTVFAEFLRQHFPAS
ncbi:alpha/beta hydrolase fold domain-containing protein [Nocardia sp. NPDC052566]|uniref:alpha/beta hydrolase fold domain-containing protein n=1 Tax=Nocardia sp. NPDC052566 TaxID=3364330 RepID=UPI0037C9322F